MSNEQIQHNSRKREREFEEEMELITIVVGFILVVVTACYDQRYKVKEMTCDENSRAIKRTMWMNTLMNDRICREQLRLDRRCFEKLCLVLQSNGGLVTSRNVNVREVVSLFLHILAHDLKNRTTGAIFIRSGETISRQFHTVLRAVLKIGKHYVKQANLTSSYARDNKWKWFEGALGAIDGTHIQMIVPLEDRPRYRDRKGDISTNVLAVCDPNLRFNYILSGWEGSASDPRVLRDALRRPNGLKVPTNKYFLVDLGFTNGKGFLSPYKGTRYHLNLWRGNTPRNHKEIFNLKYSSARNTIERAFGLLKKRWAILRTSSFFDKKTQVRIINACFILHNFIRDENAEENDLLNAVDQELENDEVFDNEDTEDEYISTARASDEWGLFRDEVAKKMFEDYQASRAHDL